MMELIKMTDYLEVVKETKEKNDLLQIETLLLIFKYGNLLRLPNKLEMFVPCDEDGNVIEKPERIHFNTEFDYKAELSVYEEAKAKVLFEGFVLNEIGKNQFIVTHEVGGDYWVMEDECLEDIVEWNLEFTEAAVKQLQLSTI